MTGDYSGFVFLLVRAESDGRDCAADLQKSQIKGSTQRRKDAEEKKGRGEKQDEKREIAAESSWVGCHR